MAMSDLIKTCPHCSVEFEVRWNQRKIRYCSVRCSRRARPLAPIDQRFWAKVDKSGDGCWLWTARRLKDGYGNFGADGNRFVRAHRFAWELTNGPIPPGRVVCHRCDVPLCVNPGHLFLGTMADNVADMIAKDRQSKAARKPNGQFGNKVVIEPA